MSRFDLCVVGGGPAGIAAAIRASDLGKRVALIDGGPLGGAGIFDGALSSKTFWHLAMDYARAARSDRGYDGSSLVINWPAVCAEVSEACSEAQSAIYFLSPEVAAVGLNEQMAKEKGIGYRAAIVSNSLNRRNIAMRATTGFVKLLVRRDERLIGLRVVGPQAGTCIQGVALLIGQGGTLDAVERCVHPHPAVTEGVLEAARLLLGRSLFKPDAMPGLCTIVEG